MKQALLLSALIASVAASPQVFGDCDCANVICPNSGRARCECLADAARACERQRNGQCPPVNGCNSNNNGGGGRGDDRPRVSQTTIYNTLPITYTFTGPPPGQPRPTQTTIVSVITVTAPQGSPSTVWQTVTVSRPAPSTTLWTVPTSKSSSSVPPPPPPPPSTTTSRPDAWTPPSQPDGPGGWNPVTTVTLPAAAPPAATATAKPSTGTGGASPQKCGPGAAVPTCPRNTYCDPQPLCSIGEDCPGVCLPVSFKSIKAVNRVILDANSLKLEDIQQPWSYRREVWQGLLDSGDWSVYEYGQM